MKRKLLGITHAIGSDMVRIIGAALTLVGAVIAIFDAFDDRAGFPALVYVGFLLMAAALVIIRPIYDRLFVKVDLEQKEIHAQQPVSAREDEQRQTLKELQDLLPRFSAAARAIYEERRSLYLQSRSTEIPASLREHFRVVTELDQPVLNLISRVQDPKIRQSAGILYELDRRMAFFEPATWDSRDLYGGYTPSFIMVDRLHQLTRMIGKILRGDSIDDEVVNDVVHIAGVRS